MNLRYQIGRLPASFHFWLLSRRWFPLFFRFRGGRDWCYDACRFSGTRDFRTVVDVGANQGTVSVALARFFPDAYVHAFEPVAATFAELQTACKRYPRIIAHRLALSDTPGEAFLQIQAMSELNSLSFSSVINDNVHTERIDVTTLALFCETKKIDAIDLLKVDAQGFDLAVLRGAEPLLRAGRVPFIVTEAGIQPDDTTNQPFGPLHEYLSKLNYRVAGIYEQLNYGPRLRYLGCFNLLYVHDTGLEARFPTARSR